MTKFELKEVTLVLDQTPNEREKGLYYLRAVEVNSPLQLLGTPKEISDMFSRWLCNTIEEMNNNNCNTIKLVMSWK